MYGGFRCALIPSTDKLDFGANNKKYQNRIVYSNGYKLIYVNERYHKPNKIYFDEHVIIIFLNDTIKENEYCSKVTETKFNKPLAMTVKDNKDFTNSDKCWICKKKHMKKTKWR